MTRTRPSPAKRGAYFVKQHFGVITPKGDPRESIKAVVIVAGQCHDRADFDELIGMLGLNGTLTAMRTGTTQ